MTANHSSIDIRTDQIKVWQNDKVVTRLAQNGCFEEYPTKTYTWSKPTGVGLTPWTKHNELSIRITRIGNTRILEVLPHYPYGDDTGATVEYFSAVVPVDSEDVPATMQDSVVFLRNFIPAEGENSAGRHGQSDMPSTGMGSAFLGRLRVSNVVDSPFTTATRNAILIDINPYMIPPSTGFGVTPWPVIPGGWDLLSMTYTAVGSADPTPLN